MLGKLFGVELLAKSCMKAGNTILKVDKTHEKTKFAGEDAFLIKIQLKDGKYLFQWVFQRESIRRFTEGTENTVEH